MTQTTAQPFSMPIGQDVPTPRLDSQGNHLQLSGEAAPDAGIKHVGLAALINACDIQLPGGQKLALIAIARCRDSRTGRSTVSLTTIGKRSGLSGKQASRYVEALVGCGLVSRVGKVGLCCVYTVNIEALAQAITGKKPAAGSVGPVDNSTTTPDISDTDPGHFEQPPRTFTTMTPDMGVLHSEYSLGITLGGESETCAMADDLVGATFPPFPILEDLKTEQQAQPKTAVDDVLAGIADKRAEHLPIGGQDIRDLIEAAAACGEMPLAVAADAVQFCRPAALATPAEPAAAPIVTPPAPPAPAVAIAPDTLAAVNAQRVRNGKTVLRRADLLDLHREATLAGIAPQTAAEWILARPSRSFFRAGYGIDASPATPTVAPTGPVELTETGKRAQAQIARALAAPAAAAARPARSVAPAAAAFIVASPSARPISSATVTPRHRAPVSVGASTGTGWARTAVERFTAGQPVSHATIKTAASALGLSLADLKAQRAAALATVAA